MKKRSGEPWISGAHYGALLPQFTVNLIVQDIARALEFYRHVLYAQVHYSDPDFAALRILGIELMLHADHTYEHNPWSAGLRDGRTVDWARSFVCLDSTRKRSPSAPAASMLSSRTYRSAVTAGARSWFATAMVMCGPSGKSTRPTPKAR